MEKEQIQEIHDAKVNRDNLMGIRQEIQKNVDEIKSNMTGDPFGIDEILDKYTEEEIATMSYEKAKQVFVDADGTFVFNEDEFKPEMILDFIKYLKMSRVTFEQVDAEFAKMDAAMSEFSEEINKVVTEKGSLNKVVMEDLQKAINNESVAPSVRQNAEKMLKGLENAKTLAPLFELYSSLSTENTLKELKDESRRISTLKAYVRVCKENGIDSKLLKLGGFEVCLDEKYNTHENLFIFIIARYVKYLDKKVREPENLSFVVQLTNYVRTMMLGEESPQYQTDKEELEVLKGNICLLLDKFYN